MKIFWSWQADTVGKVGRHFVKKILVEAIEALKAEKDFTEPSERESLDALELDQDRQGVSGSPDLAATIFRKIDEAAVFVADMTIVGATGAGKKLINPNVAIEYGHAHRSLGDKRILMIQNIFYGGRDDLPFDIRHKAGPIQYALAPDATKEQVDAERTKLKGALVLALRPFLTSRPVSPRPSLWPVRLGDRTEKLTAIAIERAGDSVLTLTFVCQANQIRIDRYRSDGLSETNFGNAGSGHVTFSIGGNFRPAPESMKILQSGDILITGTAFIDDTPPSSHAFLALLDSKGALVNSFGDGGIFVLPHQRGALFYGQDTEQLDDVLYTIASKFESGDIFLIKTALASSGTSQTFPVMVTNDGTAWPVRILRSFPENKFFIAGKVISSQGNHTNGFVVKVDTSGQLDTDFAQSGTVMLRDLLTPSFINGIEDIALMPSGGLIVVGHANEGFALALNEKGEILKSFGNGGSYFLCGTHRTDASSARVSIMKGRVSIGGMESDGNSIARGFVAFVDLNGREMMSGFDNMIRTQSDARSKVIDHVIVDDDATFALVQEGISNGAQRVRIVKIDGP